ncbi:MAG TPA: ATP-binding protein [Chryseolinea sp.]
MKGIILVGGLPGSGKSFFASRLAKTAGAFYLGSDKIRKAMVASGKYTRTDKLAVYRALAHRAEEALKKSTWVVVDATFSHRVMRDIFLDLAARLSVPCVFFWLDANEVLIKQRLSNPRPDSEADYAVYETLRDQLEAIETPHITLESTNDNIDTLLETGLNLMRDYEGT